MLLEIVYCYLMRLDEEPPYDGMALAEAIIGYVHDREG